MMTLKDARWEKIASNIEKARGLHPQMKEQWLIALPSPMPGGNHLLQLPMISKDNAFDGETIAPEMSVFDYTHANRKERVYDEIRKDFDDERLKKQAFDILGYVFNDKLKQFNFYEQGDMIWFLIHYFQENCGSEPIVEVFADKKVVMIDFQMVQSPSTLFSSHKTMH